MNPDGSSVTNYIDLYAEFSGTGGHYERFPDPKNHRIVLTDLRQEKHRATLRAIWTDPYSLDPSKKAAEVTRDIANRLAKLAKSLEADGHDAQVIAGFLQRCLFTMFAEDIGLLPEDGFKNLLEKVKASPHGFLVRIAAANLHREAEAAEDSAEDRDEEIKTLGITAAAKEIAVAAQKLRAEANKKDAEALKLVTDFHRHLCKIKVLDPACGTANFLYVMVAFP